MQREEPPLVTADDLLDLADKVSEIAAAAELAHQIVVKDRLEAVLPNIFAAAKSAALRAVEDRRSAQKGGADGR